MSVRPTCLYSKRRSAKIHEVITINHRPSETRNTTSFVEILHSPSDARFTATGSNLKHLQAKFKGCNIYFAYENGLSGSPVQRAKLPY